MNTTRITSGHIIAYAKCQRNAFLLAQDKAKGTQHEYLSMLEKCTVVNRGRYISSLSNGQVDPHLKKYSGVRHPSKNNTQCIISADDLIATCDAILKPNGKSSSGSHLQVEPHIVIGTYTSDNDHKLRLAFTGYVIEKVTGYRSPIGILVPLIGNPKRIRLEPLYTKVYTIINDLRKLINKSTSEPPVLCLNKHCQLCRFRDHCIKEAEESDHLSMMERMTPKLVRKYQKKGIFTITQLSYLYKPRRRKKKASSLPISFNIELQALAIRTNKIYLHEVPVVLKQPIELFLDVEGIPDQDFNYLIGLVVRSGNDMSYYSFWADSIEEEANIFEKCLRKATEYGNAPIYHYGSFEPRAFQHASKKYDIGCETFANRLVNVNSFVFGKVYFPTRSNRLKDLGACVGASWSVPSASGIQSLIWRHYWEEKRNKKFKDLLLAYNREDCHAVRLLVRDLQDIADAAVSRSDVDFADHPKENCTKHGQEIHQIFDNILNSAHLDYRRKRIRIHSKNEDPNPQSRTIGAPKGHKGYFRTPPTKVHKIVRVRPPQACPRHKRMYMESTHVVAEHTVIDLAFLKNGCKKTILKYTGMKGYCTKCHNYYNPPVIRRIGQRMFGHGFQAWTAYQRIVLRLPYRAIAQVLEDIFSVHITKASIVNFIRYLADYYSHTENLILRRIRASPFIHVDETKISIQGTNHYAWVLTNGTHVVFYLTETRETTFLQKILQNFDGVLISDFYPGYDSFLCKQQKCLSHLIKDLNDDLWKNPFNYEYESFLMNIRNVLVPLFEDVERYGLKARFLKKHIKSVDKFYKHAIDNVQYSCEIVQKYQKRFLRYRESLFLFLVENRIPWNNNMAERALRHLAVQRKISGSFFKEGATNYLKLLGIAQTCRFQEKTFLKFLLSGERDIDKYKEHKRRTKS